MTDFFISYTQADRAWAEWIAWVLEAAGFTTKNQAWDFGAGSNFIVEMHKAASEAERTIAVLSPEYLVSDFALMEWAAALAQKKELLPIRVREVAPVGLLAGIVFADLVGLSGEAARNALLTAAKKERPKPLTEPPFPGEVPPFPLRITDLPETKLPEVAPLPRGSRMPFARNPLFVGREEDLRTLARQLRAGDTSAVGEVEIAAASGLGGIGKTQLASEFVHRYGRYFGGGVFWMSFADPAAVPAEVAACGRSLDLRSDYDTLPFDQQIRLVEEVWTRPIPRLLVFDNCEEEDLLDRWRPRTGGSRVLVTSRRSRWGRSLGVRSVPLTTLPRPVSIDLLQKFRPDVPTEEPALYAIAAELGDLPLALHLAGSFLERYAEAADGQPAVYLEALRRGGLLQHLSLQGKFAGLSPTSHEGHAGRTFALSVERLKPEDETDALALALLGRAAHFAPGEPIPRNFLLKTVNFDEGDPGARLQAEDALGRLMALGLLEAGKAGGLVMHRLVAELARNSGDWEESRNAVEDALYVEANRLNKSGYPATLLAWQPHLRALVEKAPQREDERSALLCNELGYHLWMLGDYAGVSPYYERALAIREKVLGAAHPGTAQSLNNLGFLLRSEGDLAGARRYYERALAIREKLLGAEHPDTARSLDNFGALLWSQGDLAGAQPYIERALKIREKVLAAEHPEIAESLNSLGLLLRRQGDLSGARPYYERALAIREKVLGAEHPHTAISLDNLGSLLQSQGDLSGARSYFERALAIREKVLGAEHSQTAISLDNLGGLLYSQGDRAGARQYRERALAIFETVLGAEHPATARSLNNLGTLLQSQGDLSGARSYFERALAIWEKVLGAEHPETAQGLNNLGALLHGQGDLAGARPYFGRALAIRKKVLGAEHPDTAQSLHWLGFVLQSQGDLEGARPFYERALAVREARLGPDHPDTKAVRRSLASLDALQANESPG